MFLIVLKKFTIQHSLRHHSRTNLYILQPLLSNTKTNTRTSRLSNDRNETSWCDRAETFSGAGVWAVVNVSPGLAPADNLVKCAALTVPPPFNRFPPLQLKIRNLDDGETGSALAPPSLSAWPRNPLTMAPLNGDLSADRGALMLLDRRPFTKSTRAPPPVNPLPP